MTSKERCLDPPPDYDSEPELRAEEDLNTDTQEYLNNNKVSPPSSPVFVAFVRNDVSVGRDWGGRRGGPLGDRPPKNQAQEATPKNQAQEATPKNQAQEATRECVNCKEQTPVWYSGERFLCDEWYSKDPKALAAHNQLCEACATDETKCWQCKIHGAPYKDLDDEDEDRPPGVVWRAADHKNT